MSIRVLLCLLLVLALTLAMTGDNSESGRLSPSELNVVRLVVNEMPHVAADRFQTLKGVYTWSVPAFAECPHHWGLPLSSLDPFAALYLKGIYAGRAESTIAKALADAIHAGASPHIDGELFCDPMTWQFWLIPFVYKLPPESEVGPELASSLLRTEILANRHKGFLSSAIREEITREFDSVRASLPSADRQRVSGVSLEFDVYPPLAAFADGSSQKITLSEALVRYVVVREIVAKEESLKRILTELGRSGDQSAAAKSIKSLEDETVQGIRRNLSFILAHEQAHLWVPTIDEREADCYGLATVVVQSGEPDIGVFESVHSALSQGRAEYWNGLPASVMEQRFKLIQIWSDAARKGANIRRVCVEAWKGL